MLCASSKQHAPRRLDKERPLISSPGEELEATEDLVQTESVVTSAENTQTNTQEDGVLDEEQTEVHSETLEDHKGRAENLQAAPVKLKEMQSLDMEPVRINDPDLKRRKSKKKKQAKYEDKDDGNLRLIQPEEIKNTESTDGVAEITNTLSESQVNETKSKPKKVKKHKKDKKARKHEEDIAVSSEDTAEQTRTQTRGDVKSDNRLPSDVTVIIEPPKQESAAQEAPSHGSRSTHNHHSTDLHKHRNRPKVDQDDKYLQYRGSYHWDSSHRSPHVKVSSHEPWRAKRLVSKHTTDGVRGGRGFNTGKHLVEIVFNGKPWGSHCAVGICTEDAALTCSGYTHLFGQKADSWCLDIPSGGLFHQGVQMRRLVLPETKPNCVFLYLNMDDGFLGIGWDAETATQAVSFAGIKGTVYPCVSMVYGRTQAEIRLLSSPIQDEETANNGASTDLNSVKQESNTKDISQRDTRKTESRHSESEKRGGEDIWHTNSSISGSSETPAKSKHLDTDEEVSSKDVAKQEETNEYQKLDDKSLSCLSEESHGVETEHSFVTVNTEDGECVLPPPAVYISKYRKSDELEASTQEPVYVRPTITRQFTQAPTQAVQELSTDEQYQIRTAHGWDSTKKGGGILIYPNIPEVCFPSTIFSGKVQMIRSRQGFSSGRHKWLIQQIRHNSSLCRQEDTGGTLKNDLIVGVVSEQHWTFNYGFSLNKLSKHAWGWRCRDNSYWCDAEVMQGENVIPDIDWTVGVHLTLDVTSRQNAPAQVVLTVEYKEQVLTSISCGQEKVYFPFVVFHHEADCPVRIEYQQGPIGYIQHILDGASGKSETEERDAVTGRRALRKQVSSFRYDMAPLPAQARYPWKYASDGVHLSQDKTEADFSQTAGGTGLVAAAIPLKSGMHVIDFNISGIEEDCICIIGLISAEDSLSSNIEAVSSLGYSWNSWALDVRTGDVTQASNVIGRIKYDLGNLEELTLRMTLNFGACGNNTAAFYVISEEDDIDIGVAFICLPDSVVPAAGASSSVSIRIDYQRGPEALVHSMTPSKTCHIL